MMTYQYINNFNTTWNVLIYRKVRAVWGLLTYCRWERKIPEGDYIQDES